MFWKKSEKHLRKAFKKGKKYSEKEVTLIIADFHDDFCTIRRDMVAEGILERKDGAYTITDILK